MSVTIDLCRPCQVFWFDTHESLRLASGAVLKLFKIIGEQALPQRPRMTRDPVCPRCATRLIPTSDQQRNTKFAYLRCPRELVRRVSQGGLVAAGLSSLALWLKQQG